MQFIKSLNSPLPQKKKKERKGKKKGKKKQSKIDHTQKNSGLNGIRTHDACHTGAVLYQLN